MSRLSQLELVSFSASLLCCSSPTDFQADETNPWSSRIGVSVGVGLSTSTQRHRYNNPEREDGGPDRARQKAFAHNQSITFRPEKQFSDSLSVGFLLRVGFMGRVSSFDEAVVDREF